MPSAGAVRAGEAYVEIEGDDKGLREATNRSEAYLKALGKSARAVASEKDKVTGGGGSGGEGGSWLERLAMRAKKERIDDRKSGENALEKSLSKGGVAGFGADLLGVGLQATLLTALGTSFASVTKRIVDMKTELKEGKRTVGELWEEAAKGIPVFGGFFEAGRNLKEIFSGEKAEIEEINKEAAESLKISTSQLATSKQYHATLARITAEIAKQNIDLGVTASSDYDKAEAAAKKRKIDNEQKTKEDIEKETGDIDSKAKDELEGLQKRQAAAQDKLIAANQAQRDLGNRKNFIGRYNATPEETKTANDNATNAAAEFNAAKLQLQAARDRVKGQKGSITAKLQEKGANEWQLAESDELKAIQNRSIAVGEAFKKGDEDVAKIRHETMKAIADQTGEQLAAERTIIAEELAQTIKDIDSEAAKTIGETGMGAAGREGELEKYKKIIEAKKAAATDQAGVKTKAAENSDFEKKEKQTQELKEMQIAAIADVEKRELASLDLKYQTEMDIAQKSGKDTKNIAAIWAQAKANKQKEFADKHGDAIKEIETQTSEESLKLSKHGLALRLAELKTQRDEALRKEADDRTKTGVGADRINKLFDAKEAVERMGHITSAGSFSAGEFSRMGGAGTQKLDEIAKSTKETAKNTKDNRQKFN